jgi:hypothetical protein
MVTPSDGRMLRISNGELDNSESRFNGDDRSERGRKMKFLGFTLEKHADQREEGVSRMFGADVSGDH